MKKMPRRAAAIPDTQKPHLPKQKSIFKNNNLLKTSKPTKKLSRPREDFA